MQLTDHFTFEEFVATNTGLPNVPSEYEVNNIRKLAHVMEAVRQVCGDRAIHISSGFRCLAVNAKVGGVSTSAHRYGLACDFTVYGQPITETFRLIRKSGIVFDQLILETPPGKQWVHLGLSDATPRQESLTFDGKAYTRVTS